MLFKRTSNVRIFSLAARIVLLASLVFAAFAHTAPALQITTPDGFDERAYAAQFTLPDGTLPIICDRTGNGGTHHPSTMPCEFCSLADNVAFVPSLTAKSERTCALDLENQIAVKSLARAKSLLGLHGASRAPPSA